jgi:hypothetical protein
MLTGTFRAPVQEGRMNDTDKRIGADQAPKREQPRPDGCVGSPAIRAALIFAGPAAKKAGN